MKTIQDISNEAVSCQTRILNQLQVEKVPVYIYLKSGIKIQGFIAAFDTHIIILQNTNIQQMIYKHAISTVVPQLG